MPDQTITALAQRLHESGVGWLLNQDADARLEQIRSEILDVSAELSRRLPRMKIDVLAEVLTDPALKPLVQMFASPTTRDMRAMVYCVLRGMTIKDIEFSYKLKQRVDLAVVLQNEITGEELTFKSDRVWDVEILRHLGIMTMGNRPIIHGFYAFAS